MSEGRPPASDHRMVVPAAPPPEAEPRVIDAEFRALPPRARLWGALRRYWWALGPYLAYCAGLWGLAALVAWLIDRGRS